MNNETMNNEQTSGDPAALTTPPAASPAAPQQNAGCLSELGWLAAAPALSCFSLNFYHLATKRRTGSAVMFFFAFTFVIVSLQACGILWGLFKAGQEIRQSFERGEFPEITITDGVAEVSGQQPFVFEDNDSFLGIDTTGQYTEIDRRRYIQGLLLKRTSVVFLSRQGEYREVPLSDVQRLLGLSDPFILNGETAANYWTGFSLLASVIAFLALIVWNWLVRLAYIALIGLVVWGIVALVRSGTGFGPVLIAGLYALVPALFIHFLLGQVNFTLPLLTTFFLIVFWGLGLAAAFWPRAASAAPATADEYFRTERPLRGWRALIALPVVIDIVLEMIFNWKAWYVTWPLTMFTLIALLAVSLWPLTKLPNQSASQG
jgi:hypothetical protein